MDVQYVTTFRMLKIAENLDGPFELLPGVNITNDPLIKRGLLTAELAAVAGAIETGHLQRASNIVFGEFELSHLKGRSPDGFLMGVLLWISDLFKNAWLLKDHAMECDAVFLHAPVPEGIGWFNNFLAVHPTFANGTRQTDIELTFKELQEWSQRHHRVEQYLYERRSGSWATSMLDKGYSRAGRALQFISAARSAPSTAFKLAHYCSALETLFTTESTELAHKLSERVAFFLRPRGYNTQAVFKTVKAAYNLRSKLVHGDTLKESQFDQLSLLSLACDDYLRTTLNAIFNSENLQLIFDADNLVIENYFSQLIFGSDSTLN